MDITRAEAREILNLELRRGFVVLAVLSQLRTEQYGYSLKKLLSEKGLSIDEGTLYPLMRRLEAQGLLESAWRVEGARPRRYYMLSDDGRAILAELSADWVEMARTMERLLK
jgi:DNA-binding PadR family transcriptional regulator